MAKPSAPLIDLKTYGDKISKGSLYWDDFIYEKVQQFHINRLEDYLKHSSANEFPIPPHRKSLYDIIFVTNGSVKRTKALNEYTIKKNQIFFLPAYQITSMSGMFQNAKGFFCHFDAAFINELANSLDKLSEFNFLTFNANPVYTISKTDINFITSIFERLLLEYKKDDACNLKYIYSILLCLFYSLQTNANYQIVGQDSAANIITQNFNKLLLENISNEQGLLFYANNLSITVDYLNKCVKKVYGKTAKQYLDEMFLLEAKVLLKQSNLPIAQIANQFGKHNASDFSRFFKQKTGMTPLDYRKKS